MRSSNRVGIIGSILALSVTVLGCGGGAQDPYPRVGFAGTVTLDGAPMKNGFLYLEPLEKQPTQAFAVIEDGAFEVHPSDGAVPGRYRVAIVRDESFELPKGIDQQTPEGSAMADKLSRESAVKPLDPSYNVNSKLVAELELDGMNEFDFKLKSNPGK